MVRASVRRVQARRQQSNPSSSSMSSTGNTVAAMMQGRVFRPPSRPPVNSMAPWNLATVVLLENDFSKKTYTAETIYNGLVSQLGLRAKTDTKTTNVNLDLMFVSVSVWVYPKDKPSTLNFQPLGTAFGTEFVNMSVTSSGSNLGSIGFIYPTYNSPPTNSVSGSLGTVKLLQLYAVNSPVVEIHFKTKWRGSETSNLVLDYVPRRIIPHKTVDSERNALDPDDPSGDEDSSVSIVHIDSVSRDSELIRRLRDILV